MKLAVVGAFGGTHLGASLTRAAKALGIETFTFDTAEADGGRLVNAIRWRLADRQPVSMRRFALKVMVGCEAAGIDVLVSTGRAAMSAETIKALRRLGVKCVNFASDDPWNVVLRANWHLRALPHYDLVLTPRHANLDELRGIGCRSVAYLPFGYDDQLFSPGAAVNVTCAHDVLFVGGADRDRVAFMHDFMASGPPVALVGGYWRRFGATRGQALGLKTPGEISALTAAAKVNLCLVRRANRDGHVMRSLEIAAIGGTMLAEDTADHRAFFGEDGECVVYFSSPSMAAARARVLIEDEGERKRLAEALGARIAGAHHTYRDRLQRMLEIAGAMP